MKLRELLEMKDSNDPDVIAAQKFFDAHPHILSNSDGSSPIRIYKEDGVLHARLTKLKYDGEYDDEDKWTSLKLVDPDIKGFDVQLHEVYDVRIEGTAIKSLKDVKFPEITESNITIFKVPGISSLDGIGKCDNSYSIHFEKPIDLSGIPVTRVDGQLCYCSSNQKDIRTNPVKSVENFWIGYYPFGDDDSDVECQFNSFEGFPSHVDDIIYFMGIDNYGSFKDLHKHVSHVERIAIRGTLPDTFGFLGLFKLNTLKTIYLETHDTEGKSERLEEILNKHLKGDRDIPDCMEELMDAGLTAYAKL